MKKGTWTADWVVALVICLVFEAAALLRVEALEGLERIAYEVGVRGFQRTPSDRVAVIAIDDRRIDNLGRWPWPRNIHADMIDTLRAGGVKVVGNLIFYSEPQIDPGLRHIEKLRTIYASAGVKIPALGRQLDEASKALNTDAILAASLRKAGNVVLPMAFDVGEPLGNPDAPLPEFVVRNTIDDVRWTSGDGAPVQPPPTRAAPTPPIAEIGLPVNKVLNIVIQAAEALDYAHKENVVHRDIKPANIMYEPDSENVKLTDFGIARITDSSRTKTGMVLGTPSYMSPEQLSGRKVDGRSDLFSLGVMLFQLCTGQLPFKADSMANLMYKIANDTHPSPMDLRPDLPPCLRSIIDSALAKPANDRYSRGAEMVRNLRACAKLVAA